MIKEPANEYEPKGLTDSNRIEVFWALLRATESPANYCLVLAQIFFRLLRGNAKALFHWLTPLEKW